VEVEARASAAFARAMKTGATSAVAWHAEPVDQVLRRLKVALEGLAPEEAKQRLTEHGRNELKEAAAVSPWRILAGQFSSLIVWILIAAGVIAGLLGETVDAIGILAIVALNAIIGFHQEFRAEKSIAALKRMTAPHANVRRGGSVLSVPAAEVVPGDIVELEAGDLIPADARIMKCAALKCMESALTGESEAVEKQSSAVAGASVPLGDRSSLVFMGTTVVNGTAQAVVVGTGMQTEIGRIAHLLQQAPDDVAPLQRNLQNFGRLLVWASLGIVVLLFVLGLLRGEELFTLFMTSVSLAVAAVPEGLPTVVTISLALGVSRMARRRALVRRLSAVETLGSTSVICTDKTGTLTIGEMTVRELWVAGELFLVTGEGYAPEGSVRATTGSAPPESDPGLRLLATNLVACNNAHVVLEEGRWKVIGDPTEGALLVAGQKAGIVPHLLEKESPRAQEIPFDSDRKRRTVIRRMPDRALRAFVNGAPDVLLQICSRVLDPDGIRELTAADRKQITEQNEAMAARALRVLGAAMREVREGSDLSSQMVETDLVFVGLAGMYDPPRNEAKDAVARCHSAGIRVVMITGDHPRTALAIARELGIADAASVALAGAELEVLAQEELVRRAPEVAVYARVTAEHKLRIINAWRSAGNIVAMTGDGVNDAPAIKGADIGIAMGKSGTEVTKQAADIIVTDDNFASIVAAVEEGRGIYANIRKTLQYLLAGNCGELLLMAVCVIIGLPTPLLAIHLLWINLVTDGLPAICLATDPIDADVMRNRPRARGQSITGSGFFGTMLLTGSLTAGVALGVYLYGLRAETPEMARTHAFGVLVFAELLRSFGARSETKAVWRIPFLSNVTLLLVVSVTFAFQVFSHHYAPLASFLRTSLLPLSDCLMLLAVSTIPLLGIETFKAWKRRQPAFLAGRPIESGLKV
jgi:P-type Ca2+ transporter type 2C